MLDRDREACCEAPRACMVSESFYGVMKVVVDRILNQHECYKFRVLWNEPRHDLVVLLAGRSTKGESEHLC